MKCKNNRNKILFLLLINSNLLISQNFPFLDHAGPFTKKVLVFNEKLETGKTLFETWVVKEIEIFTNREKFKLLMYYKFASVPTTYQQAITTFDRPQFDSVLAVCKYISDLVKKSPDSTTAGLYEMKLVNGFSLITRSLGVIWESRIKTKNDDNSIVFLESYELQNLTDLFIRARSTMK